MASGGHLPLASERGGNVARPNGDEPPSLVIPMAALEREIQKGGDNGDNDPREEQKSHGEDLRLAIKPRIKDRNQN